METPQPTPPPAPPTVVPQDGPLDWPRGISDTARRLLARQFTTWKVTEETARERPAEAPFIGAHAVCWENVGDDLAKLLSSAAETINGLTESGALVGTRSALHLQRHMGMLVISMRLMVRGQQAPSPIANEDAGAERLFNAYNETSPNPWKTWDGKDVPRWPALSDQVREKWRAVFRASRPVVPPVAPLYPLLPPAPTAIERHQVEGLLLAARRHVVAVKVLEEAVHGFFGGNPDEAERIRDCMADFAWGHDEPAAGVQSIIDGLTYDRTHPGHQPLAERLPE
jgi:hypothetical protein